MATQGTYYLDAPSLSSATIIYSDAALTIVADDGFYSDGVISREQTSGVLLPQVTCPSCAIPCGGTISASGGQGVYYLDTDLGTDTGAVIVRFDPAGVPDGILAVLNSINYNAVVSPGQGYLQGDDNLPTYIGQASSDCGLVANSPYTLNEYEYNGTSFVSLGTTRNLSILSTQLKMTGAAPGNTVMVIPKTTASPSILALEFIGPCSGTVFNISVACPAELPSFASSSVEVGITEACADTIDQTYYVAYVNGSGGVLGLYDLVFSDPNGEFKLAAGFYKTTAAGSNDWFEVDVDGIIITFGACVGDTVIYFNGLVEDITTIGVDNYAGQTFDITLAYDIYALCDNEGTSGSDPNSATTTLFVSTNGGSSYTTVATVTASVSGGNFPTPQSDTQTDVGTYVVTGVTDVSLVKVYGGLSCDTGLNGKDGNVTVVLSAVTSTATIVCDDRYILSCSSVILDCTII
jgi:hypothetical protein